MPGRRDQNGRKRRQLRRRPADGLFSFRHFPEAHSGPHWTVAYTSDQFIYVHHFPSEERAVAFFERLRNEGISDAEILTPEMDD
jgi:hypothetical protein